MVNVIPRAGLDASWTAESIESIQHSLEEGSYFSAMSQAAFVQVAAAIDTLRHTGKAVFGVFSGELSASFWHGIRGATHGIQAGLTLPAIIFPKFAVATTNVLQINARWEPVPEPLTWKGRVHNFFQESKDKFLQLPPGKKVITASAAAVGASAVGGGVYFASLAIADSFRFMTAAINSYSGEKTIGQLEKFEGSLSSIVTEKVLNSNVQEEVLKVGLEKEAANIYLEGVEHFFAIYTLFKLVKPSTYKSLYSTLFTKNNSVEFSKSKEGESENIINNDPVSAVQPGSKSKSSKIWNALGIGSFCYGAWCLYGKAQPFMESQDVNRYVNKLSLENAQNSLTWNAVTETNVASAIGILSVANLTLLATKLAWAPKETLKQTWKVITHPLQHKVQTVLMGITAGWLLKDCAPDFHWNSVNLSSII